MLGIADEFLIFISFSQAYLQREHVRMVTSGFAPLLYPILMDSPLGLLVDALARCKKST